MKARTTWGFPVPVFSALPLVAACSSSEAAPGAPNAPSPSSPTYSVTLAPNDSSVSILRDRTTLVRLPATGIAVGRLPAVDEAANYDPTAFVGGAGSPPAGLEWLAVQKMTVETET